MENSETMLRCCLLYFRGCLKCSTLKINGIRSRQEARGLQDFIYGYIFVTGDKLVYFILEREIYKIPTMVTATMLNRVRNC